MTGPEIFARLVARFPSAGLSASEGGVPSIVVPTAALVDVAMFLRDDPDLAFDYPASFTAIDYMEQFEVVYQLRSIGLRHDVNLKSRVDRASATLPSLVSVWRGADFQEREIFDLMGITFDGHPDLRRILLWDEFVGHPLRKDYALPAPMPPAVEAAFRAGGVAAANIVGRVVPGPRALDGDGVSA
ncbi:MAG: NADH-quinone oxidoreductase subunit C [Chloroflexota bacterium]|nr:MAG: NADH-quinone oxidoreductase subunit C [Chloroflexota bacterium]